MLKHKLASSVPLMKTFLLPVLLWLLASMSASTALAEKADRDKPMNIESDAMRYDDLKQVNVFSGRVIVTKGSIQIRGDKIEVRQDPQGYQFGQITGSAESPAFFRQKRDGVDEFIEGEALTIDYDGKGDVVKFISKAQMRRYRGATLADEVKGNLIIYENLTDVFTVDGGNSGVNVGESGGRVRAMLTPKVENNTKSNNKKPIDLRPSTSMQGGAN